MINEFRAKTDKSFNSSKVEGLTPSQIEESVRVQVNDIISDFGIGAVIDEVVVIGSRCRGLEGDDSDLDVVLTYTGSEPQESFFNTLHDEKIYLGNDGVELDINPIRTDSLTELAEFLTKEEANLAKNRSGLRKKQKYLTPNR